MLNHVVNRKASRVCFGDEMIRQLAQVPVAVLPARCLGRPGSDKSPDPSARFYHATSFQLGVNFGHGVGVDAQLDRQLAHRWQLVADAQLPGRNRKTDRPFKLSVKRCWMVGVYLEHGFTIVLRQWYK